MIGRSSCSQIESRLANHRKNLCTSPTSVHLLWQAVLPGSVLLLPDLGLAERHPIAPKHLPNDVCDGAGSSLGHGREEQHVWVVWPGGVVKVIFGIISILQNGP